MMATLNKDKLLKNFSLGKKPKTKKNTKSKLQDMIIDLQNQLNTKNDELIDVLKEKGDSFTSQIRYIDTVEEQKDEVSKNKEIVKEIRQELKEYKGKVDEYLGNIIEIAPNIRKCKNKMQVFSYLEVCSLSNKIAEKEDIEFICSKLKINKENIKNYDENLYNTLKVKDWEIED